MTNPTSNFSWQMPTPTDLVTDLPADFEVFGQAVDSDLADLLGGTTGQVLSKTSATDLAFTWIDNDEGDITGVTAGTGITVADPTGPVPTVTNSMATEITTAGDIIQGTGSGTFSRLGIGTVGQVLAVNSGATATEWTTLVSGGLTAINPGGTSLSGTSTTISSIPSTYKSLYLVFTEVRTSAGYGMYLRMNADTGANYSWGMVAQINNAGQFDGAFATTDGIALSQYIYSSTAAMRKGYGEMSIINYTETEETAVFNSFYNYLGTGNTTTGTTQGVYNNSAAVTSITVRTDGAQTFTGGKIYLYGVN